MLLQAILIGIWAGIAGVEQFNGTESLHRPIVSGLVVGLILGDVKTGLMAGATMELAWLGLVPLAGAQPPNIVIGGIAGIVTVLLGKQSPELALGVAVPFAVLAQVLINLLFTIYSPIMHKADEYAKEGNIKGIDMINFSGPVVLFAFNFLIIFSLILFGADKVEPLISALPEKLVGGFKVASGMMPAVGFAMLLNIMLKKEYVPFMIGGFVLAAFLGMDLLAITLLAVAIALYDYYTKSSSAASASAVKIEEDCEDGI